MKTDAFLMIVASVLYLIIGLWVLGEGGVGSHIFQALTLFGISTIMSFIAIKDKP